LERVPADQIGTKRARLRIGSAVVESGSDADQVVAVRLVDETTVFVGDRPGPDALDQRRRRSGWSILRIWPS
jgi:hypothetical protein